MKYFIRDMEKTMKHILDFKQDRKLNNSGSTLIVVLVGVSFLTVIAAIIMTISSANLRMKQLEYASKENFYVDEIGLDDIYNGIGKDVSAVLSRAYAKILMNVSAETNAEGGGKYTKQNDAYVAFASEFCSELKKLYPENATGATIAQPDVTLNTLNGYITRGENDGTGDADEANETLQVVSYGGIKITPDSETGAELYQYRLNDVKVKYIEDDIYESTITTDIVIEVPYIDFFQNFDQVLDYAMIGNKGITFKNGGATVEGSIYAGIASASDGSQNANYDGYNYDNKTYDGMNFYKSTVSFEDSSYIVSKGDFNICESSVTIQSGTSEKTGEAETNLWAENIRTVEKSKSPSESSAEPNLSTLEATANIYAADDLELNARNSQVTLNGNYYGYNYNNSGSAAQANYESYDTFEYGYLNGKYTSESGTLTAAHTTSSSIILNAKNSTLDLTGLNTLMVAGVAYIDIKTPNRAYGELAAGSAQEYRTGESIAARYNQFYYLAPTDILNGVSNPQKDGTTNVDEVLVAEGNTDFQGWFGHEYVNAKEPLIAVVYSDNNVNYTYYFLNIIEGREKAYIESFMSATNPGENGSAADLQKWELKQEILNKMKSSSIASHIIMKADGTKGNAKIYTTGLLTDTTSDNLVIRDNTLSLDDMVTRSTLMQRHYAQLYVNLEPNKTDEIDEAKRISTEYPIKNFLDLSSFTGAIYEEGKEVDGVSNANVWLINGNYTLDLKSETKRGIVLCNGDLTIKGNGGTFEGMIIATGKIIVDGSSGDITIRANRGIAQAVLESEQRSVLTMTKKEFDETDLKKYASYYFKNSVLASLDSENLVDTQKRVSSMEYTDYIYYENWQKGETE